MSGQRVIFMRVSARSYPQLNWEYEYNIITDTTDTMNTIRTHRKGKHLNPLEKHYRYKQSQQR
jgi:hypothetical protein